MADSNVRHLKDKAFELLEKQKFDDALEIYKTLLHQTPDDTDLMLKVGELHRLLGQNQAAVDVYVRAVELFTQKGLVLRGIAVCKIIHEIDPGHKAGTEKLAELYSARYGSLATKKPPLRPSPAKQRSDTSSSNDDGNVIPIEIEVDLTELEDTEAISLPNIPLLSDLDEAAFVDLLKRVPLRHFAEGETVVLEDELGSSFFILVEGGVQIIKSPDIILATLGPGAFFGEMAVIAAHRRRASVITTATSQILEISRTDLDELTRTYPHIYNVLTKFTEERLLQNLMVTSPLFSPFPPKERGNMLAQFEPVKFLAGQKMVTQGEKAQGLYIIISGEAEIEPEQGRTAVVSEGEMFGETALLLHTETPATVRAKQNTRALFLPRSAFNELIMTHPQVLELVSELKENRIRLPDHRSSLPRDLFSELDGGSALL